MLNIPADQSFTSRLKSDIRELEGLALLICDMAVPFDDVIVEAMERLLELAGTKDFLPAFSSLQMCFLRTKWARDGRFDQGYIIPWIQVYASMGEGTRLGAVASDCMNRHTGTAHPTLLPQHASLSTSTLASVSSHQQQQQQQQTGSIHASSPSPSMFSFASHTQQNASHVEQQHQQTSPLAAILTRLGITPSSFATNTATSTSGFTLGSNSSNSMANPPSLLSSHPHLSSSMAMTLASLAKGLAELDSATSTNTKASNDTNTTDASLASHSSNGNNTFPTSAQTNHHRSNGQANPNPYGTGFCPAEVDLSEIESLGLVRSKPYVTLPTLGIHAPHSTTTATPAVLPSSASITTPSSLQKRAFATSLATPITTDTPSMLKPDGPFGLLMPAMISPSISVASITSTTLVLPNSTTNSQTQLPLLSSQTLAFSPSLNSPFLDSSSTVAPKSPTSTLLSLIAATAPAVDIINDHPRSISATAIKKKAKRNQHFGNDKSVARSRSTSSEKSPKSGNTVTEVIGDHHSGKLDQKMGSPSVDANQAHIQAGSHTQSAHTLFQKSQPFASPEIIAATPTPIASFKPEPMDVDVADSPLTPLTSLEPSQRQALVSKPPSTSSWAAFTEPDFATNTAMPSTVTMNASTSMPALKTAPRQRKRKFNVALGRPRGSHQSTNHQLPPLPPSLKQQNPQTQMQGQSQQEVSRPDALTATDATAMPSHLSLPTIQVLNAAKSSTAGLPSTTSFDVTGMPKARSHIGTHANFIPLDQKQMLMYPTLGGVASATPTTPKHKLSKRTNTSELTIKDGQPKPKRHTYSKSQREKAAAATVAGPRATFPGETVAAAAETPAMRTDSSANAVATVAKHSSPTTVQETTAPAADGFFMLTNEAPRLPNVNPKKHRMNTPGRKKSSNKGSASANHTTAKAHIHGHIQTAAPMAATSTFSAFTHDGHDLKMPMELGVITPKIQISSVSTTSASAASQAPAATAAKPKVFQMARPVSALHGFAKSVSVVVPTMPTTTKPNHTTITSASCATSLASTTHVVRTNAGAASFNSSKEMQLLATPTVDTIAHLDNITSPPPSIHKSDGTTTTNVSNESNTFQHGASRMSHMSDSVTLLALTTSSAVLAVRTPQPTKIQQ